MATLTQQTGVTTMSQALYDLVMENSTTENNAKEYGVKKHVLSIINDLNNGPQEWRDSWEISENPEPFTAYDYLEGVLDINWVLNSDRTLKGARLLVAFGGPNIWIDTSKGTVEGAWWGDAYTDTYNTDSEFAAELDDALETLFNC